MYDISVIVTAAGRSSRMREDLLKSNLKASNKLTLPLANSTILKETLNNTFKLKVDEIILVLGHYKDEIIESISDINEDRLKIVENKQVNVGLSSSLLNGLKNTQAKTILATTGDQPTIQTKTYQKILKHQKKQKEEKYITILRRIETGKLKTAKGLGMPFATNRLKLIPYLEKEDKNLNPILQKMHKDKYTFYGIKEENPLELININHLKEYEYVKENYKN